MWTEAVELLFYLVSTVNRSHCVNGGSAAQSAGVATMFTDLVFWFAGFTITDLVEVVAGFAIAFTHVASASPTPPPPCAPSPPCAQSWFARSTAAAPLHHLLAPLQRLNAHRRPRLIVRLQEISRRGSVAGREGGRSCGKRERKELREERKEGVAGRERGRSCRFAAWGSRRVGQIETLNKLYGFGSSNNRSHIPLFGTGSCWTEAYNTLWHRFYANRGL